jgi:hypothetical protein
MENNRSTSSVFALLLFPVRWMRFQASMRKRERAIAWL